MAWGAVALDATAYPANSQTMTARLVAQILSDERMAESSCVRFKSVGVVVNYNTKQIASPAEATALLCAQPSLCSALK
jgi:hypothetical protein